MVHKIVLCLFLVLPVGLAVRTGTERGEESVTYNKDVAPILFKHCVVCHHANDMAPMSLMTYQEVRPWATSIREKLVQRTMPPWHVDPRVGE